MSTGRHESFTAEYCTGETVTLYGQQQQTSIHLQTHANISNVPLNQKGEPIKLPDNLESLPRAEHFPIQRHRWNTNEEIAAILINFERHGEWQSKEVKVRPKSGSMLLYSRKKVRYRRDGYCWKKRKDGKTTREDHMKLKVQGTECIYGCYVHSAILPTFHRRCYWLLQNPDMVLVHYLNVPYPDDNKLSVISPSLALWADRKEWTKDELVSQLKPMFYEEDPDHNNDMEVATGDGVSAMVTQLMEWQKNARASLLSRTLECGCPDSTCADGQSCSRPIRRILSSDSNQVSSTTGSRARTTTMLFTTHPVNPARITITTARNGQSTVNTIGNNLLTNSTKDFCSQPQQQQIILKNDCSRDNGSLLNNRQHPMIGVPENNGVYKQQPAVDNTMLGYNDHKQSQAYHSSHAADEHVHVYQSQQDHRLIKQQQQQQTDEHVKSEFYDVTLDLSHDDIQQTLSANMPPVSCAGADQLLRLDDTRNNKTSGDTGDDDVFVSLDAFDMLTDLQELDMLENAGQQGSAIMVTGMDENLQHSHGQTQMDVDVLQITDYCPEWAFPEGGVKVLITGPWFSSSSYTVMFDTIAVPSTLVQGGVLRCYCPAHDIGTVTLQVVIDGRPVSTTAMFEYRQHEIPLTISSLTMPHTPSLLKLYLLQKLDTLEDYLQTNSQHSDQLLIQKDSAVMLSKSNFENWLVDYCDQKKHLTWKSESECNIKPLETGTTLLHIAAFLGYSKLVCKLLQWKLENASLFLELEVNVSKQDRDGYTPLMWACKKGHKDTAVLLCQWYQTTHSADNTFNLDFCQTDILESVHQYFNDFDQNEYYASENLTNENMFTNPNEILCDDKKDINTQQFDGHNSQAVQMDNSLTRISSGNENKPSDNNILNLQSVQYVKRPIPNSFSENDECYNQFCKPIQYYPSVNQFQKSFTLPLQSPNSDSGISLDRSPVLNKSNFIICLVTSLSEKPAAAVAAVAAEDSSSDGGGNGVVVSPTDVVNQNQSNRDPDGAKIHKATDHEAQNPTGHGEQNVCVLTLAEQFIAAMPEHIKNENEHRQLSDTSIIEIIDDPPSTASPCCFEPNSDISTEFNDKPYRHHREREIETPTSSTNISLSPMSSASQCSPISPPPTAADLSEFLHASVNNQYVEKNFSNLTLSDYEQRELYEAAKTIQKAYRTYKKREEYKEVSAASVIQNYYRRYKQFAYYKQITKAVVLIQNQFRSYKRQKRIKKEISHYTKSSCRSIKRNQTQKRQNQAAKKIQHFIRHNNESMPPPVNFAEHTYGYHERDDNTDHSLKYNMPTNAAQYSSAKSTI